ncbi:MAG: hypothetical protein EXX96DRAFT_617843 [Benjaminiella poitrasii]|nr:MAG: hypothetical protein EXX96DRAFT_617843 [Benjaminiella poitrasii]
MTDIKHILFRIELAQAIKTPVDSDSFKTEPWDKSIIFNQPFVKEVLLYKQQQQQQQRSSRSMVHSQLSEKRDSLNFNKQKFLQGQRCNKGKRNRVWPLLTSIGIGKTKQEDTNKSQAREEAPIQLQPSLNKNAKTLKDEEESSLQETNSVLSRKEACPHHQHASTELAHSLMYYQRLHQTYLLNPNEFFASHHRYRCPNSSITASNPDF